VPGALVNLRLLQLGDSALPIGGYSHSWGLEAAVERGLVRDAADLERWVRHWLRDVVGPGEGVVVGAGCRAATAGDWATVARANALLWAGLTPPTLRHASRDLGDQLLALAETWPWAAASAGQLRRTAGAAGPGWHHTPVFATLAAAALAAPADAVAVYLHQAALGAIGAGVRAVPVGHTHGQQVLARLHGELAALAGALAERDLDSAGSFCPAYEELCHAQNRLYTRLFRS
jgi:urease accessory protein